MQGDLFLAKPRAFKSLKINIKQFSPVRNKISSILERESFIKIFEILKRAFVGKRVFKNAKFFLLYLKMTCFHFDKFFCLYDF